MGTEHGDPSRMELRPKLDVLGCSISLLSLDLSLGDIIESEDEKVLARDENGGFSVSNFEWLAVILSLEQN